MRSFLVTSTEASLRLPIEVKHRAFDVPQLLSDQPRTIWYVIDEDKGDFRRSEPNADRATGAGFVGRPETYSRNSLATKVFQASQGLFISPFVAQAKNITKFFAEERYTSWTASTVHSQQGAQAKLVIFDTVNASSTSWSIQEWLRLVNVGISRAEEFVILIASRSEMQSPYLKPLLKLVQADGPETRWLSLEVVGGFSEDNVFGPAGQSNPIPAFSGIRSRDRKSLRPV